ncbi:uncharacterized protein BX663DRAFT_80897 [Cokeromyces recurvatus]|uniref:uncharacterized protein n=1 Tax=Cokeromyces recurvatus TaxID=90255 RepID=UPI00222110A8|nr:uncharacterized protein BX663DRAFT_80897 [Cokeromyces recurvatus]KAI7902075.1 hypothetical protein BX663DRAFT_80897 [Cokeromyces recurvatus]
MVDFWKSEQKPNSSQCYLTNRDLADMAVDAKKLIVPPQFTTISSKISANFSGFKGDEFRSWTIVYSAILLKGRLIGEHMMNWLRFVMANQILASSTITVSEVNEAHNLLVEFIKNNVDLYGPNFITPNMHMHLHLQQTIYDFGPLYSTWLYSFERANGDIKKIDINFKEGLEFTYMEKFLQQVHVQDYLQMLPDSLKGNTIIMNVLKHLIPNEQFKQDELILDDEDMEDLVELDRNDNNSLHQERSNGQDYLFDLETFLTSSINTGIILTGSEPLPPSALPLNTRKVIIMNNHHYNYLYEFYRSVYSASFTIKKITDNAPSSYLTAIISDQIQKFDRVNLAGQLFRCMESRTDRGAYIQAMVPLEDGCFRVGKILYFFTNEVFFPNNDNLFGPPVVKKHFFAFVRWYKPSVNQFSSFDIHNVEVWKNEFEADSILSILPLCQIHTCVALAPYIDSNVLVLPLPRRTIGM